ncbi:LysR family transcriptional regulator [Sphingobium chungbukense]|uniref:LysR family transcriptional regulator n=1 Tax=Sphingobium chungbukense TaxID=56193 RepID=A0A0M3AKJ1_9SPHN|nr:LysR family transcriptional regulator [Sphingobium chungbukense]KKW90478.1 LysR family transcriptional regulator [Sphingobium chungbukense]
MDYLAAMRAFVRAVDLGSFSRAAEEQNLKVSTVSRYVSYLEHDLGAALLNRSTRSLHLTEAGTAFFERAVAILADVEDARQATTALNARPQGLLRVALPGAFGRHHVIPHMAEFHRLYPDIRLDLHLSEETVDLIATGMDFGIRIGALADSTLVARKLARHRRVIVASPDYLDCTGVPASPSDVADHACLLFALQARDAWFFASANEADAVQTEVRVAGAFRSDDSDAMLRAAIDGLGLALLPTWLTIDAVEAGALHAVLTDWDWAIRPGPERAIWGIYPPKKTLSPKVRAFLNFMAAKLEGLP